MPKQKQPPRSTDKTRGKPGTSTPLFAAPETPPSAGPTLPELTPGLLPAWVVHTPRPAARQPAAPPAALPGDLRSTLEGVVWPAIPPDDGLLRLAVVFQLEQTQWWPLERLHAHQFHQLGFLVRHAHATVPYYRKLFDRIGFDPAQPLKEEVWRQLPILDRRTLQASYEELKSASIPKGHGKALPFDSSGSTGMPVRVFKTDLQMLYYRAITLRDHFWHKRDLSLRLASISDPNTIDEAPYPDGVALKRWGTAVSSFAGGKGYILNIISKLHEQVEWLQRVQPHYLTSYPSNLDALAHYCMDHAVTFPTLRQLRSTSEPLKPQTRELCRKVFGVEIAESYSTEEVGYIAQQSPASEQLLTQAETVFVEILDEEGRPCAQGQVGRVVVTPLHAFAMPLIRYAVGDLAEAGGPAACGRTLPTINRVLGRERNMVRLPNGMMHYPSYADFTKGLDKVIQFQVVRKAINQLEVRLVVRARLDGAEEEQVRARTRERFQYPFEVKLVYMDEIARTPGGKFLDYVSEVD